MVAVKMRSIQTTFLLGALAACGGAKTHTGYPEGQNEPWTDATKMTLTANGEATAEGNVNFPKRQRARWYVLELPAGGSLRAKLRMDPLTTGADLGFEVLDSGFNVVAKALDDNDIGQDEKLRSVKSLRAGRVYFHVFTLQATDVADYRIRVTYDPDASAGPVAQTEEAPSDPRAVFPWTVPNLPPLPAVPDRDDAPRKGRAPRPEPTEEPVVVEADPAEGAKVRANIIEFGKAGPRVRILVNKGSEAGVEVGWMGYVVDKQGKSIPKGAFKVSKTRTDESEGFVNLTLDQVQANRTVVLKQP
jgi:hypothetical protein